MVSDFSCASTYYISNYGNDNNNGLSPVTAWRSIEKLNSAMTKIKPGDAVLFERDGYFSGQINLTASGDENNSLIFGAYGEGRNPVITGAVPLVNWSAHYDNIYKTTSDTLIKNLFSNGRRLILARYPNSGFMSIKNPFIDPKTGFTDSELKQSKGYWNGSNVRMRTINWAYEHSSVKDFTNGKLTFSEPTYFPTLPGWGYFLDNNLDELDSEDEWFSSYDYFQKGVVYFKPDDENNPANLIIEGSIYGYGFYSFRNLVNVKIQDLNIKNQYLSGIYFTGNKKKIDIINCTFNYQSECGINLLNISENCNIANCNFYDINGKAIYLLNAEKTNINNNIFRNIGMMPGYGVTGDSHGMSAIVASNCNSIIISGNNIENTGHDGINCIGYSNLIEKNVIKNSLLLLNDGGAIKSYGKNNTNTIWKNNFIFNVPGNLEGTAGDNKIYAAGNYLDAYCSEMSVINNTIVDCGLSAINMYDECNSNTIKGNVCYGNQTGIYIYKEINPFLNNSFAGNIFYGLNENNYSVMLKARSSGFVPGKFDSNYYCNPFNSDLFVYQSGQIKTLKNFNAWKNLLGNNSDLNSKVLFGSEYRFSKLATNMSDDTIYFQPDSNYGYKDIDLNNINEPLTILPWTSKIVISKVDVKTLPEINVSGGSLNFNKINEGSLSPPKWIVLYGDNLNTQVKISAPKGFVISRNHDINFTDVILINPENKNMNTLLYVRFNPDEEKNYLDYLVIESAALNIRVKVLGDSR